MIFIATPLLVGLWARQGRRGTEPFAISKMAFGCLCVALANLVMAGAAAWATTRKASALWLLGFFFLSPISGLHPSPVGLAVVSKNTPPRVTPLIIGGWFLAPLPAGLLSRFP